LRRSRRCAGLRASSTATGRPCRAGPCSARSRCCSAS
jgi:hypothetical protein